MADAAQEPSLMTIRHDVNDWSKINDNLRAADPTW
jgi:hypothetical protein